MTDSICIHCFISGKVQGVWFRASAKKQAALLGVTGWARNLSDGRVEVIACGEKKVITQFHAWLKQGPELAKVTDVSYEEVPLQAHDEFVVL